MEIISMEVDYLDVVEAVIENKFLKLSLEFDELMYEHSEKLSNLDREYMTESTTEDDLYKVFKEEVEKTAEKSKGLLSSMISAVKALFKKIKDAVFGTKYKEEMLPDQIEVGVDPKKLEKSGNEINGQINNLLSGDKSALKTTLVEIGTILGAVVLTKEAIVPAIKNLQDFSNETDKTLGRAQDAVDKGNLNPDEQTWLKKAIGNLRACGAQATKIIKAIPKMGTQEYKDIAKKNLEERKKKSVLRRAVKNVGDKVSSTVKGALDSAADERISDAQENRDINNMRLPELQKRMTEVTKEISSVTKQVSSLKNQNAQGGFFSKHFSKLSQMKSRLSALEKKGEKKTDAERDEYVRLQTGIADVESKRNTTIKDLEKKLKDL